MKTKIKLLFILGLTFNFSVSFSQEIAMPLDGNTNDLSGNNHHGVIHGNVTPANNRLGVASKAYHFGGTTNDFIYVPFSMDFYIEYVDSFSVSLWAQPENSNFNQYIFAKKDTNSFITDYDITDGQSMICSDIAGCYSGNMSDFYSGTPQKWYHIVLTYSNGLAKMYVNDTLRVTDNTPAIDSTTAPIIIGQYFKGEIDDINYYKKALSAAEIDNLYKYGSISAGIKNNAIESNMIKVYPNPASDYINIDNKSNSALTIVMTDVIGKVLYSTNTEKDCKIDLRSYTEGVYFIRATSKINSTTYKIVKN